LNKDTEPITTSQIGMYGSTAQFCKFNAPMMIMAIGTMFTIARHIVAMAAILKTFKKLIF
jgi:hypothetical protein